MITIENTYNTAVIYADQCDSGTEGLLRALCGSPLAADAKIRIMPDVHPGKGCAVGTTMTFTDKVAPGLVGVDIGCGMEVFRVSGRKMELQKLDRIVREEIPAGSRTRSKIHRFADRVDLDGLRCARHVQMDKALRSIGTLGGGNHFIEVDEGEDGERWLVIHSGSRHLGYEVAGWYQQEAFNQSPDEIPYEFAWASGELLEDYLHDMAIVQEFAAINRQAMADEIMRAMKLHVEDTFSTVHNYIDSAQRILRKGAVSAKQGERLIIPLNMRDGSLLCIGKGNEDWNCSAPHGAGRLLNRAQVRQSVTLSQFKKEMRGIFSSSVNRETLDESPMAYKDPEMILSQIEPTVEVTDKLHPIYNFKAGSEQ